jgi:WhiB family transcriptional regulator, redox-sensing transcriptional regulator
VRELCLDYALDSGLDHGIFGGTTETERRELRRRTRTYPLTG